MAGVSPAPLSPSTVSSINLPANYAGKFDPKAIAKKSNGGPSTSSLLGKDVTVPDSVKAEDTKKANSISVAPGKASGKCSSYARPG